MKLTLNDITKMVGKTINVLKEHYSLTDTDELMEYMWLRPHQTGVRIDIFVDDGKSYERNNHSLVLFARNGYSKNIDEFICFSVSETPIILNDEIEYNISYNDIFAIQDFIQFNLENLVKLANNNISQIDFVKSIKVPSYVVSENKGVINEMATLKASSSNLPMDIWLDEGATFQGHAPRIKFKASNEQRTTREFSSMLLTNPPTIENFPKNSPLKTKDINKLKQFVINNLDALVKLANGEISFIDDFLPNMIID